MDFLCVGVLSPVLLHQNPDSYLWFTELHMGKLCCLPAFCITQDFQSVTAYWVYDLLVHAHPEYSVSHNQDCCWLFSFATNKELWSVVHCHPTPYLYKAVSTASGTICEACLSLIILAFTSIPVNIVWRQGIYYWCATLRHATQLFIAGWHEVQDHDLWKALTLP